MGFMAFGFLILFVGTDWKSALTVADIQAVGLE